MSVLRNHEICRLCLHYIKDDSDILIDTYYLDLENEKISLKRAFAVCLPEVDLTKTVQQHICSSCLSNVITLYKVKRYINESEERVLKYFAENKLIRRSATIDLNCIITEDDELQYIVDTIDETFRSVVCLINQEKLDEKIKKMCAIKNITFRCFVCEYETTDYHLLKRHYVRRHSKTVEVVIDELFHEPKQEKSSTSDRTSPDRAPSTDRASSTPSPPLPTKCRSSAASPALPSRCAYVGCEYSTVWAKEMLHHKSCHLKNYLCFTCKNAYVTPKFVQCHGREKHKMSVKVQCKYCSYVTAEPDDARKHFDSSHGNEDINVLANFKSAEMTSRTDELNCAGALNEQLGSIERKRSRDSSSSNNEKFIECPSCPFKTYSITVLQKHKKQVHSTPVKNGSSPRKRNHSLSPVSRTSQSRGQTAKKKTAVPAKPLPVPQKPDKPKSRNPFGCFHCSKSFQTCDVFMSHFKKNHSDMILQFKCNLCSHTTNLKYHLQRHLKRYHSYHGLSPAVQKAPVPVPLVKKLPSTVKKIVKRKAMKMSNGGQPGSFVCESCRKRCRGLSYLMLHRFTHSKPYECPYCGDKFTVTSNLRCHFNVHHPTRKFGIKCRWCVFTTDKDQEWNKHFKANHKYTVQHLGDELFRYWQENNRKGKAAAKGDKKRNRKESGSTNARSSTEEAEDGRSGGSSDVEDAVTNAPVKVSVGKLTEQIVSAVVKELKTVESTVRASTPAPAVAPSANPAAEPRENGTESRRPVERSTSASPVGQPMSLPVVTREDAFSKRYKAPIVEVPCFVCDVEGCEYKTTLNSYYERHKQSHSKLKFKCVTCKEKFPMMRDLDEHSKVHANSPVLKCCFCSFGNKEQSVLVRHYTNRHTKYNARELQYAMVPMEERSRRWNSVEVKGDPDNLIETVTCSLCGLKAPGNQMPEHLKQHVNFPFLCVICEGTFSHRRKLIKHIYEHQKPEDGNSAETKSTVPPEVLKNDKKPETEVTGKYINPVGLNLRPVIKQEAPDVADGNIPPVTKTERLEVRNSVSYTVTESEIVIIDDDD